MILQITASIIIIQKSVKSRRTVNVSASMKFKYKFSFTILMLNAIFIITQTPQIIGLLYLNFIGYNDLIITISIILALGYLVYTATLALGSYMFLSLFFINILFNRIYSKEFLALFNEIVQKIII